MKSWFCSNNEGLDAATKMSAYAAGFLIGKNNPDKAIAILPVATGIKQAVDSEIDNEALNSILRETISELVSITNIDPMLQAAINGVLSSLNIDVNNNLFPNLNNTVIKDLVGSFVNGLSVSINSAK